MIFIHGYNVGKMEFCVLCQCPMYTWYWQKMQMAQAHGRHVIETQLVSSYLDY